MSKTPAVLDELETILPKSAVVTDVCSLKAFVCGKKRPYKFVGGHPMAGTEFSGFESSFETLFEGAVWALNERNESLEALVAKMGAKPFLVAPDVHDAAAAKISHLPMLLAQALFDLGYSDDVAKRLAASGFRDMTRLAATSSTLACDMLELNRENIYSALDTVIEYLKNLKTLEREELLKLFADNSQNRTKMYDNGKNTLQ
jgi:prephenate dehydrogenase